MSCRERYILGLLTHAHIAMAWIEKSSKWVMKTKHDLSKYKNLDLCPRHPKDAM